MSLYQSTYHSKTYKDFKEIDSTAYRQIIRFFEKREESIGRLDFEEYFELLVCYVDSLFEVGQNQKHLLMVDLVIEQSITQNIQLYRGEDIFFSMLFKKAASYYCLLQYDESEYVLRELLKMNPENKEVSSFLKKCLRKKGSRLVAISRATSIFLFLLTAFLICMEVLLIRPFYRMYAPIVENSRIFMFVLGLMILLGGDLLHRLIVEKSVNKFVSDIKAAKSQ